DQPCDRTWQDYRSARPFWLWEIDALANSDRTLAAIIRNASLAWQITERPDAQRRHCLSELRALPLADRHPERRSPSGSQRRFGCRAAKTRLAGPRYGRS